MGTVNACIGTGVHGPSIRWTGRGVQARTEAGSVMGWGGVAAARTAVKDLPSVIEATVTPQGQTRNRDGVPVSDKYGFEFDGYGIVSVSVYLPIGERLPKGGVKLSQDDFIESMGTDKPKRGTQVGGYRDTTVGGVGESLRIYMEAPNNFEQFEAVHIVHG